MISVNYEPVAINSFTDGTMFLTHPVDFSNWQHIHWNYEDDREIVCLIFLVKHLRAHGAGKIHLHMDYIPYARHDRATSSEDVFTLKYFTEILNSLNLTEVSVLDPHSYVSEALIKNIRIKSPLQYIERVLVDILPVAGWYVDPEKNKDLPLTIFYPDEGAMKRYSDIVPFPYAFGVKRRSCETGLIRSLDVVGDVFAIDGKDVLIVDDICSSGETALRSAQGLKELGAKDIYLYVTHCENTILGSELLDSGLIKKVYTTNSIFTKEHELIEVI